MSIRIDGKLIAGSMVDATITKYNSYQNYPKEKLVYDYTDGLKIYKSLVDDNKGNSLSDTNYWECTPLNGSSGSGYDLFDIVIKDRKLSFEESKGLAVLGSTVYKEGVAGLRYGYPDFYERCLNEYNQANKLIYKLNINISEEDLKKQTNINEGLEALPYFTQSDTKTYVTIPETINLVNYDSWEFTTKINYRGGANWQDNYIVSTQNPTTSSNFRLGVNATEGRMFFYVGDGNGNNIVGGSLDLILAFDNNYYIKVGFTGSEYYVKYNQDGSEVYTDIFREQSSQKGAGVDPICLLDMGRNDTGYCSFMDLKLTDFVANNQVLWKAADCIAINTNGHIYYNKADERIVDLLSQENQDLFWYYGINEDEQSVKLPKNSYYFKNGTEDEVGTRVEAGLPNITGNTTSTAGFSSPNGAFYLGTDSIMEPAFSDSGTQVKFDASRSNSIYGNSNTVQPPSINVIPYMVVGNTNSTKAITEVVQLTSSENDGIPLLSSHIFDITPSAVSWIKISDKPNPGIVYEGAYNYLLSQLESDERKVNVINTADMIAGEDYSLYWKVDTVNKTFYTPTRLSISTLVHHSKPTNDNPTWFELYSDGRLIQGSTYTVTPFTETVFDFPIKYNNTPKLMACSTDSFVNIWVTTYDTNQNQFKVNSSYMGTPPSTFTFTWEAKGYVDIPSIESYNSNIYFKVGNAVENLDIVDIAGLMDEVEYVKENSADISLSNITAEAREALSGIGIPDYSTGVACALNTSFTTTYDCAIMGEMSAATGGWCKMFVDGVLVQQTLSEASQRCRGPMSVFVKSGSTVLLQYSGNATFGFATMFALKG